jgi:hypothetical protein
MIERVNLRSLPPAARAVAAALLGAISAAADSDATALRDAAADLAGLDSEQTGTAQGMVTRMLLEQQHPDGLDGDDIRAVLEQCTRWAASWLPETDPHVLLIVLAGALGIHPDEHEGVTRPTPSELAVHAPILIAHLLRSKGLTLEPYLAAAFAEIARTQTMEAP